MDETGDGSAVEQVRRFLFSGYAHEHRPLGAYATLVALFNALFAGFLLTTKAADRRIPERVSAGDIVLLGVATHKASRLLSRDWVTSFLRAPFTRFEGKGELPAEVSEEPRGRGFRYAMGELLTCPYCVGQWLAAFFAYGLVFKPPATRLVGSVFAILTIADFLHLAYVIAEEQTEPDTSTPSEAIP